LEWSGRSRGVIGVRVSTATRPPPATSAGRGTIGVCGEGDICCELDREGSTRCRWLGSVLNAEPMRRMRTERQYSMTWRTWASLRASSARSEYSTRAVGFWTPPPIRPRYCGPSSFSPSSRRPRASLVAVPSEGMRSPRTRREMVEWSTPDCWASCRCDIFLALSCARSHSLKARPLVRVMPGSSISPESGHIPRSYKHARQLASSARRQRMQSGVVRRRWVRGVDVTLGGTRGALCAPGRAPDAPGGGSGAPRAPRGGCLRAGAGPPGGAGGPPRAGALGRAGVHDRADDDDREDADR